MVDAAWLSFGFEATLQSLILTGRRFHYRPGFYVRSTDGLLSGSRVSFRNVTSTRRRGVLSTPGSRDTPRGIVIGGFAYDNRPGMLQKMGDRLGGLLPDETDEATLSWEDLGVRRRVTVAREGASFVRRGSTGFADWQIMLRAPDQTVLGDPMETSGWGSSVEVTNRGTHSARVLCQVRGARPAGYTIVGPRGARAIVTAPLVSGTPHEYDGDTGALSIGGAAVDQGVSRSDVLEVPHGTHTLTVTAPVELFVTGFDTYMP